MIGKGYNNNQRGKPWRKPPLTSDNPDRDIDLDL